MRVVGLLALGVALAVTPAGADDVRPVQVHIREREPDNFLVQWLVPKVLPIQAIASELMELVGSAGRASVEVPVMTDAGPRPPKGPKQNDR